MDVKVKRVLQVILISIIIYTSFQMYFYINNSNEINAQTNELQNKLELIEKEIVIEEQEKKEVDYNQIEVEKLKKLNEEYPNIIGWIKIPNTSIDYPVVQGKDNEFYLDHDYKGNYNVFGAIYLEKDNDKSFTDENSVIYGHRANTKQMFYDLLKYQDKEFAENNNIVKIITLDGVNEYEIFASYEADPYENFRAVSYEKKELNELKSRIDEKNVLDLSYPDDAENILTLQTCLVNDNRFVIHANKK